METKTKTGQAPGAAFNPLTGWEAASRWNAATLDWMTRGFQQWFTLMTTVPPRPDLSAHPQAEDTDVREELREERPAAHREPKRPARAKAKTKTKPKARARG
jgi:hypothetical protein